MPQQIDRSTDVTEFIGEMNAGVFQEKLGLILSDAALGVLNNAGAHCKKAKVTLEFNIEQIGDNDQVIINHKLGCVIPTKRGKKMEEDTTQTSYFVGKGGKMTITPPKEEESGQLTYELDQEKDGKAVVKIVN